MNVLSALSSAGLVMTNILLDELVIETVILI